jgi:uncharacterized membrane protein YbhN (UPF0104 family)
VAVLVLALEILLVGFVAHYLFANRREIGQLWRLRSTDVALFGVVLAAEMWLRGVEFRYAVRLLGADLSDGESHALSYSTSLFNYAPMNAGTVLRARVLKRARSLTYAHYVALMSGLILLSVVGGACLGLLVLAVERPPVAGGGLLLGLVFTGAIVGSLAVLHLPPAWVRGRQAAPWRWIEAFLDGWLRLRANPRALALLLALAVAKLLLLSGRFWICFGALQLPVDYLGSVLFAVVTNLLVILSITPGALGVRELLIGMLAAVTSLSFAHGVAAASLDRVLSLVFVAAGAVPSLCYLRSRQLL